MMCVQIFEWLLYKVIDISNIFWEYKYNLPENKEITSVQNLRDFIGKNKMYGPLLSKRTGYINYSCSYLITFIFFVVQTKYIRSYKSIK